MAASRIDMIGLPLRFVPCVSVCNILPCPHSDHSAVLLNFTIPDIPPRGPYFWKLNTGVLDNDAYVELIIALWKAWQSQKRSCSSLLAWWDIGKRKIQVATMKFCLRNRT